MLNVLMAQTYGPSNTTADHSGVPPNQTKVKEPALLITRNNINKGQYLLWIQTVFEDGRHLRETPSVYRVGLFMGSLTNGAHQGWTGRKIQPWHFLSRPAHYIISTRGGTKRTGRTLYIRIIVQFFVFQVCVSCAADKKVVKPEQEVNRHPVVAASPPSISTTKPLLNITHDPTQNPLLQLLVCDCENRLV